MSVRSDSAPVPPPAPNEPPAPNGACPRCGASFRCGIDDTGPCPCTTIDLDAPALAALNREYRGCLCLRCLAQIAAERSDRG